MAISVCIISRIWAQNYENDADIYTIAPYIAIDNTYKYPKITFL